MQCSCAILPSVSCSALQYFSTSSHKWHSCHKKCYWTLSVCFDFLYNFCLSVSHSRKNWVGYGKTSVHVKSHYFCQILMKLEFFWHIFKKYRNIKFHDIPSRGSWGVPCRQMDMMKLIVTFHSFANVPKKGLQPPSKDGIQLKVSAPEKLISRKHGIL